MGWRAIGRFVPAIAWAAVIFRLSSIPGSQIPGRFSVLGHLVMYSVLGALLAWSLREPGARRRILAAAALASAYGVTDEIHQLFVRGRSADPLDWVVDTAGALLGATLVTLAGTRGRRAEEQ